jgi:hypothetical protein
MADRGRPICPTPTSLLAGQGVLRDDGRSYFRSWSVMETVIAVMGLVGVLVLSAVF